MKLTIIAAVAIAAIGTIAIGILLHYNKQTHVVWVTYATIMATLLPFFLAWHQLTVESHRPENPRPSLPEQREPVKPDSPAPLPEKMPTPTPAPASERTSKASQIINRDDYEPDEKDKRIIRYLYKEVDCLLPYIAKFAELDTQETKLRLNRLAKHGYVRLPSTRPTHYLDPYTLRDKGIQFAIENNLRSEEQHAQKSKAKVELPPVFKPDEIDIKILVFLDSPQHQNIYVVEVGNSLRLDQKLVRTRLDILAKEDYVRVTRDTLTNSDVCSITPKGSASLDKPRRTIPHPNPFSPDKIQIRILQYLADPNCTPLLQAIAEDLQLSIVKVESTLYKLIDNGYLTANSYNEWNERIYRRTRKAIDFLADNDLG
jgi:DNA-binding MarR family transcriptional regulator